MSYSIAVAVPTRDDRRDRIRVRPSISILDNLSGKVAVSVSGASLSIAAGFRIGESALDEIRPLRASGERLEPDFPPGDPPPR